jgi:hypothetical protein
MAAAAANAEVKYIIDEIVLVRFPANLERKTDQSKDNILSVTYCDPS